MSSSSSSSRSSPSWRIILDGRCSRSSSRRRAIVLGFGVAILLAAAALDGAALGAVAVDAYVELMRNTPFLVQLFIIFFGLPSIGIRMSAEQAALLAMTLNLGAYSTEIVRAGIESIHKSQIEAGLSLAMTRGRSSARGAGAGDRPGLAGAVQPVRADDARLEHLLLHLGAGALRHGGEHRVGASAASRSTSSSPLIYLVLALVLRLLLLRARRGALPAGSGLGRVQQGEAA